MNVNLLLANGRVIFYLREVYLCKIETYQLFGCVAFKASTRSRCESTNGLSGTETRSTLAIVSSGENLSMGESLNERFGIKLGNNDAQE